MTILRASLSVVGLMIWDNTLFDNFNVPTGMDKSLAVDEIMRKCGDLELMWPDWDFMHHAIGNWSSKTAVAQAHIDFFGDYVVGVYAQFGERLFGRFEQMCVDKHVFGQAADEIFQ